MALISRKEPSTLLLGPVILLFGAFALLPMIGVIVLSFTKWDGLGSPVFTGLANWARIGHDDLLVNAVGLSVIVMIGSWLFQTPVSLLLGTFVAGPQRHRAVLAAFFFLPMLLSAVAISIMWRDLLDPNFGLFAAGGLLHQQWLGGQSLAVVTVVFVLSWQYVPFHILIYQAGARQIPRSMYE